MVIALQLGGLLFKLSQSRSVILISAFIMGGGRKFFFVRKWGAQNLSGVLNGGRGGRDFLEPGKIPVSRVIFPQNSLTPWFKNYRNLLRHILPRFVALPVGWIRLWIVKFLKCSKFYTNWLSCFRRKTRWSNPFLRKIIYCALKTNFWVFSKTKEVPPAGQLS